MIRRALAVAVLAMSPGSWACHEAPSPAWHVEAGYRWRDLDVPSGTAGFTRMDAGRTRIRFQNSVRDSLLLGNRILAQGAGVCLGDVDGDGRPDVFLARTDGSNKLYRNLGDWRFADITDAAGIAAPDRYSTGCAFADLEGDGDLDLVLLATTGPNAIFLNDAHAHFDERRDLGPDSIGRGGTTIAMADVDGDGDLDLYVANYKPYSPADAIPPQSRAFNQTVREVVPGRFAVRPEYQKDFKLIMRPDLGGMYLTMRGEPDQFYLNDRGRLTATSLTSGRFSDSQGRPLSAAPESFALGAKFVDLNADGAPDLYVANDFEDPDLFFFNDGRGNFRLADWTAQRQMSNSSMGIDVGDLNGDGLPDLFAVDMLSDDPRRRKTQIPTHTAVAKRPGDMQSQLQMQRNTLFLNRGDGTFVEVSEYAGVQASGWSWSTMLLDVDLDGWQDVLVATGHPWDLMDADTQERLQNRLTAVGWQRQRWEYPKLPLRNVAYRNLGNARFANVSEAWGFGTEADISHGMAAADLDGDGDLDVVVNRLDSPVLVLRDDASAPRVAVRLAGDAPNTRAVGAKIRVLGGPVPIQEREIVVGGLYMSHSDYLASFATGTAATIRIEVDWRDGRRSVIADARPNRLYEITMATVTQRASGDSARGQMSPTLFEDATSQLGGHSHTENTFDDWGRQFLLPDALSQLGPGVAWFDVDRDGAEELVIGSGKGGRLAMFRNSGRQLVPVPSRGPVASADLTTVLGLWELGGASILAGASTWEARTESAMTTQPAVVATKIINGTLTNRADPLVGSHASATGPLALADYDGDGDLDLFVGSRAIPMRYPVAPSSGLFAKDPGGRFVLDTANSRLLRDVGLVSAAVFADVNGDGHPDLLLAREWQSILLLLNDGHGRFSVAANGWGLSRWTSRWHGLATGDLDGDGRLDLVATSWGRNTVIKADSARPLFLYHGPFGAVGEEEMLLARAESRAGRVMPLASYASVRTAVPDLVSRIRTFAAYADATAEEVLGPAANRAQRLEAITLDNMAFLNRGNHFVAVPLPAEAQFAPAFYAGIADFDGDGQEDVFLSQNFYPTAVGTPRYDAGRSLLLLGHAGGALTPMAGAKSGLLVYGDQRGAAYADFDRDGRLDLVVSQNGAATRLFRNRGAKPGIRVRLQGGPGNPDAVGAQLRIVYADRMGPVREVQAGSGYWSQNGATQVLGLGASATALWVRWPGGEETRVPVSRGATEMVVTRRSPGS